VPADDGAATGEPSVTDVAGEPAGVVVVVMVVVVVVVVVSLSPATTATDSLSSLLEPNPWLPAPPSIRVAVAVTFDPTREPAPAWTRFAVSPVPGATSTYPR